MTRRDPRHDPIWHPRVGPGVRVSEMTDEHIDNALSYLIGRAADAEAQLDRIASMNFYSNWDRIQYKSELEDRAEDTYYWIKVFEDEQLRRRRQDKAAPASLSKLRSLK